MSYNNFSELLGRTLSRVVVSPDNTEVHFYTDRAHYQLSHTQNCCEYVSIEDVEGDLEDLVGSPITLAEEATSLDRWNNIPSEDYSESFTWTFYRLATAKGFVVFRWLGESNGYYSESVDFERVS